MATASWQPTRYQPLVQPRNCGLYREYVQGNCDLYWGVCEYSEYVQKIVVCIGSLYTRLRSLSRSMYRRLWSILRVCTGDCGLYWEYVQEIIVVLHKYVYLIFLQPSSVVENHLSFYSWSLRACFNFYGSGESNLAIGMHRWRQKLGSFLSEPIYHSDETTQQHSWAKKCNNNYIEEYEYIYSTFSSSNVSPHAKANRVYCSSTMFTEHKQYTHLQSHELEKFVFDLLWLHTFGLCLQ